MSFGECRWRRRRRGLDDNDAGLDGGRRPHIGRGMTTEHCGALGNGRGRDGSNGGRCDIAGIDTDDVFGDGLAGGEGLRRGGDNCARDALIDISNVSDVYGFIYHDGCVVIVDDCFVNGGVRDVYVVDVSATDG